MKLSFGLVAGLSVCLAAAGCDRGTGQGNTAPVAQQQSGALFPGAQGANSTTEGPRCWLDKLNGKAIASGGADVGLPAAQSFEIAGWLVGSDHRAADEMQLVLTPASGGDARSFPAVMGVVRVDVAEALRSDGAKTAGFTVQGTADQLAPGRYKATAQAKSGSANLQCNFNVVFDVPKAD